MEYWDVVIVITAIVGLFATVLPFFTRLNKTLGELNTTVELLKGVVNDLDERNRDTHKQIFKKIEDHETRISHLEK